MMRLTLAMSASTSATSGARLAVGSPEPASLTTTPKGLTPESGKDGRRFSDIVGGRLSRSRRSAEAKRHGAYQAMKELLRTNDPVLLSYVSALLEEGDIAFIVADTN